MLKKSLEFPGEGILGNSSVLLILQVLVQHGKNYMDQRTVDWHILLYATSFDYWPFHFDILLFSMVHSIVWQVKGEVSKIQLHIKMFIFLRCCSLSVRMQMRQLSFNPMDRAEDIMEALDTIDVFCLKMGKNKLIYA